MKAATLPPCKPRRHLRAVAIAALLLAAAPARAAPLAFIDGTRYIMHTDQARLAVAVRNEGTQASLLRITLSWQDPRKDGDLPLALSRPLLLLPAGETGGFEVLYQGQGLPADRESAFILSLLELPGVSPAGAGASLKIAPLHRFKLFLRPALAMTVQQAWSALDWRRSADGTALALANASPYHLTLGDIEARDADGKACAVAAHFMIAPFSAASLAPHACGQDIQALRYHQVEDNGTETPRRARLDPRSGVFRIAPDPDAGPGNDPGSTATCQPPEDRCEKP